ncbi:MAG: class II D-tagatose-bisphosphate aldolase, non-catalytic subunit [Deltaproteobacteria bacterium]|jgi:D-tagatose-1,6-bisphosphate aldolase subunit GatZ/KbaZ|nr:class II D-tagatose-bisphosphate aldolase, non-catalytic subunit [Deltaproteobacteria bacterium]
MNHLLKIVDEQKRGIPAGVVSVCSANEIVIEAAMESAAGMGIPVLVEATANQVNQFGGYTGMKPGDFKKFVLGIADAISFDKKKIILGGDHLGPLTWVGEDEESAMKKAEELVYSYALEGFAKIHLDTSMRVASDSKTERLSDATIARRAARLCRAAEDAFQKLKAKDPKAEKPLYVIGSEVPIPGGAQEEEDSVSVTTPGAFKETVRTFKEAFEKNGLSDAWSRVIAVVVQPGVEFGDAAVIRYDGAKARDLCASLREYPGIVFEGHSTDYQTPESLREMVADGVAILKVGPALTFALREGLFALCEIENELVPAAKRSYLRETLMECMSEKPDNWKKHYRGSESEVRFKLKYSYSDRLRYYLTEPEVTAAISKLVDNLSREEIPDGILSQWFPVQYPKVRLGELKKTPRELLKDRVKVRLEDYNGAFSVHTGKV